MCIPVHVNVMLLKKQGIDFNLGGNMFLTIEGHK
jgi:hypothetical protein